MHNPARFELQHHKNIPWPEKPVIRDGEVASPNVPGVIPFKGSPGLGSWLVILAVPIGVAALGSVESSFQEPLQKLVGVVLGVDLLSWGYALWSNKPQPV